MYPERGARGTSSDTTGSLDVMKFTGVIQLSVTNDVLMLYMLFRVINFNICRLFV